MKQLTITTLSLLAISGCVTLLIWSTTPPTASAHCQVPCGIYDDDARIAQLKEDTATIAKAITQINLLAETHSPQSLNQAIRWTQTKELHASHIITTISEYFLTQKIKPVAPDAPGYNAYLQTLARHHGVMVAAMKTKQSTDQKTVETLTQAIEALSQKNHKHKEVTFQPAPRNPTSR